MIFLSGSSVTEREVLHMPPTFGLTGVPAHNFQIIDRAFPVPESAASTLSHRSPLKPVLTYDNILKKDHR